MLVRAATQGPAELAKLFSDREIVDAGDPPPHEALWAELPILVPIGTKPIAGIVMPLVGESHGDPILAKGPHFLDQPIVQLPGPLSFEKCHDRRPAREELGAISPDAV